MLNESTSNEKRFAISALDMPRSNKENGLGKVAAVEKDLSSNPLVVQSPKLVECAFSHLTCKPRWPTIERISHELNYVWLSRTVLSLQSP